MYWLSTGGFVPSDSARRARGDFRVVSEVEEWVDSSGDLTDERGTRSGSFKASDINSLRRSSSITDPQAGSPIDTWRVHPSLRSVVRTEGTGSRIVGFADEESEGPETFEVSESSPLRDSSNVSDSLAESPIVMFGDRGNSLRNNSRTDGMERCA
jgi:hypothetical protein